MSDNENSSTIRKRTSLVWQYFEKLSSSRVKCRICQHEQRYMGNTANALRHLKVKHDVDCRSKGLEDPENVKRMKALSVSSAAVLEQTIAAVVKSENRQSNDVKGGRTTKSYEEDLELDPYSTDNEPLVDYLETRNNNNLEAENSKLAANQCINNTTSSTKQRLISLEEKRIIAETEYYREKAGYFRIQKHLAALQAKKVKCELEHMYGKRELI